MITEFGVLLPEAEDLPALPRGVIYHWTGGGPKASREDRAAYHLIVEDDGAVVLGDHPVAANMRQLQEGDVYAAHTGGFNSFRVGIAAAGMRGYRSRQEPGDVPLKPIQIVRMCELGAYFCRLGRLDADDPEHVFTHLEGWTLHRVKGVRNDQKLDIEFIPHLPHLRRQDVGPFLRYMTAGVLEIAESRSIDIPEPRIPEMRPIHPLPPLDLTRKEAHVVQKNEVIEFLRKELTEDRTDRVLGILSDQAKKVLPDIPVEIARRALDVLIPEKLIDALDEVLPG